MTPSLTITLIAFVAAASLALFVALAIGMRKSRVDVRLHDLAMRNPTSARGTAASFAQAALPRIANPLMPRDEQSCKRLKERLIQAGLYKRHAMVLFLGCKMLLTVAPVVLGFLLGTVGLMPMAQGLLCGGLAGICGTIAPSFWLDRKKARRQTGLRRSMPDALDVIVICLEGGLSLQASFFRVASELRLAHPMLATEMNIVQREIQLGRSMGEALRQFAERFDVEEIRSMASLVRQAERFGASVVRAMRVHADALRLKRQQRAEEMAQRAGTKMLIPTLLCIFPALFVVIMGPAAIQIMNVFAPR